MCDLFPGRSLEEIDQMDYPRIMRMVKARSIISAEEMQESLKKGNISAKDISPAMWDSMSENNKAVADGK